MAAGLGYRFDLQARLGNGIYALSLRRGFPLSEKWNLALGARGAYNSGQTFVEYADDVAEWVKLSETRRFDGQLFVQAGPEWGEFARLWFGAKGMVSPLRTDIDATRIGGTRERVEATIYHAGGFVGAAIGYRWISSSSSSTCSSPTDTSGRSTRTTTCPATSSPRPTGSWERFE